MAIPPILDFNYVAKSTLCDDTKLNIYTFLKQIKHHKVYEGSKTLTRRTKPSLNTAQSPDIKRIEPEGQQIRPKNLSTKQSSTHAD